jgi:DNA-binding transcriptional LysR family regulator
LELRQLRYFVAVAEELHFRRAAERLHVAQPAVSTQIRKLEAELDVRLLDRVQRSVALTNAGAAFVDEARRVLRQADAAARAARGAGEPAAGRLRVGYVSAVVPPALPRALQRFRALAPGMDVVLEVGTPPRIIEDVRRGHLDAAVIWLPAPVAGLRITSLGEEAVIAAVPATHGDAPVTLERLESVRLVLLPRATSPAFYDAVIAACRQAGVSPPMMEIAEPQVEHALLSVAAGVGVALLPESVAERYVIPGVRFRPLAAATPRCEVVVVSRRDDATTITAAFLRAAVAAARNTPLALAAGSG